MGLTASALAYVFVDRFVPTLSWFSRAVGDAAVTTPSTGTLVQVAKAEAQCVAVALWDLRRAGFIRLTEAPAAAKKIVGDGEVLAGLEALLLVSLPDERVLLQDLFVGEVLGLSLSGVDALLAPVQQEAAEAGAIRLSQTRRRGRCLNWSIHSQYEVKKSVSAQLQSEFQLADELGRFGRDDHRFLWLHRETTLALAAARPGLISPQQNPVW
jgi:hypothetical protein